MDLITQLQGWLGRARAASSGQPRRRLDRAEREALLASLAGDRPGARWLAAEALAADPGPAGVQALAAALSDPDPILRWEAAAALARSGSPAARSALLAAVAAAHPVAQAAAADTLGLMPAEPETLAALAVALASRHAQVRQSAAEALARLAARPAPKGAPAPGAESVPALLELLQADPAPMVRRAAALALGRIGDPAARDALEACQIDPRQRSLVREAAAVALTRLPAPAPPARESQAGERVGPEAS